MKKTNKVTIGEIRKYDGFWTVQMTNGEGYADGAEACSTLAEAQGLSKWVKNQEKVRRCIAIGAIMSRC